jgi:MerC mercury resistance protein
MNTPEAVQSRVGWDAIGVGASTLCLIHCVLTPVALSLAPVLSEFLPGDTTVHRVVIVLVVAIGLLAFIPGYRKHRKLIVFLPMFAGVWAIGLGAFGDSFMGSLAEKCITILGSTLVITAHGLNRTFCKYCDACISDRETQKREE